MADCRCRRCMPQQSCMPPQKREGFPDHFPVGMTYVPWQTWNQIYDFDKALQQGTLFPELDKPFIGRRACL